MTRLTSDLPANKGVSEEIGFVRSKGELYPPKRLREMLSLKLKTKVKYRVSPNGYLIIETIHSPAELLKMPSLPKVSPEETESLSKMMQEQGVANGD